MRRFILLLLVFASSMTIANEKHTLLVLGDSLSAGYGIEYEKSWVRLLETKLNGWHIVNASVSGETSKGGLARLPKLLEQHQPDIVIIELGANDGLRAYPTENLQKNLYQMIQQSREAGARVLILGMQMPPNYGKRYTEDFAMVYKNLTQELNVPWVPFFMETVASSQELLQSDNIHPNEAAQPVLLDNVWKVLGPMIL